MNPYTLATPLDQILTALQLWRNMDCADNVKLSRHDVITIIEGVKALRLELQTTLAAVIGTIGGTVENNPTSSINYLQRLRELVDFEKDHPGTYETLAPRQRTGESMSEWRPIETAPKDGGRTYLILRCSRPSRHTCVGTFYAGRWKPIHADLELAPIDWMPLPEPPSK